MLVHNVTVSVFAYEDESPEEILHALKRILPDKAKVERSTLKGFEEQKIVSFSSQLARQGQVSKFLRQFLSRLSEPQKKLLLAQKESRLDSDNFFFIRLLKPDLLKGRLTLTDSGNCFHVRLKIAAYPGTRDKAMETLAEMFSQ
jgi:hypothetical protein